MTMIVRPRIPTLTNTVLIFLLMGPFVAGLVVGAGNVILGLSTPGESSYLIRAFQFGLGWWFASLVKYSPWSWFFTILPTSLAAIAFWALTKRKLSRTPNPVTRGSLIMHAFGRGALAAIIGWALSMSVLFKLDLRVVLGMFLFAGAMVVPTGAILGLLMGWWYSREIPNCTVDTDARNTSARGSP